MSDDPDNQSVTLAKGYTLLEYNSEAAKSMAEMLLVQNDIRHSIKAMEIWHRDYAGKISLTGELSEGPAIIGPSLFRDAVVQFVGCFHHKDRHKLRVPEVYAGYQGADTLFEWLQGMRDAYAAHSFGAWRQAVVGIIFDDSNPEVQGIGWLMGKYAGPDKADGPSLIHFMTIAMNYAEAQLSILHEKLEAERAGLSKEYMATLPRAELRGVDPQDVRLSRSQMKKKVAKSSEA